MLTWIFERHHHKYYELISVVLMVLRIFVDLFAGQNFFELTSFDLCGR